MGGGASAPRQPLESLSADNLRELVEGLGPKYADIAKQLQENGYDGEVLAVGALVRQEAVVRVDDVVFLLRCRGGGWAVRRALVE